MRNVIIILTLILAFSSCKSNREFFTKDGFTQGTTYHIVYKASENQNSEIDSLLNLVNKTFSLYDKESMLSKVNERESYEVNEMFVELINLSTRISNETSGGFDISVGQLVNAFGFGNTDTMAIDSALIDSLRQYVGFEKININGTKITKIKNLKIDLNAIAQGYTCDVIADYFDKIDLNNYLVEIGGEVRAKGVNDKKMIWKVGIDKPVDNSGLENRELQEIILLENKSLATSGNYRKFYVKNGVRYSHTINPKTGYPVKHNLLSVTVLANTGAEADAYATSFMVLGLEKAMEMVNKNPDLKAYFISANADGTFKIDMSNGMEDLIFKE
ncbi:MAG TPA: thiamine biosynthesis protein ApbE [Bacteroidales bacterium]|nr:MAG: hypothetical protein A2W98_10280 [Bacteroidetes bacterium GWF2_33_38]OFY75670.1 MAG: hypothetical protein A2265_11745 [Bacteroidetes bacterium RIFOXYA12_FULL_33_9]OFY91380.1 MAG: hypothetical protein A2236_12785 [Bacteroidetes bacterium RIFOXYA2_FULL_33_7]HBF89336.1 thiamine biosynthesis protein ApbE [Bacteroidales bacterium]